MRQLVDGAPTRTPAPRDREQRHDRHQPSLSSTRLWALLEALAYAGAFIDPTGVLAAHRFRRAEQEESRHGGR